MSTTTTAQRTRTPAPQQIDAALCHACGRRAVVVIVFSANRDRAMDSQRGSCNIHLIALMREAMHIRARVAEHAVFAYPLSWLVRQRELSGW